MALPFINNVVKAGDYRKRITIKQPASAVSTDPNDLGAITGDPTIFARSWAKISSTKGREYQLGLQVVGESSDVVEMRYLSGITPEMQVIYADDRTGTTRTLDINAAIDPDERHIKHYLFCSEATAGGV